MKKQMQGIALILFGIALMVFSMSHIAKDILAEITPWIGLICGIVGLITAYREGK